MKLTLVGLPLGNIEDISLRAISSLKKADLVICEDTRVFRKLWLKLVDLGFLEGEFSGKLEILNEFNEKRRAEKLAQTIGCFERSILVSDAGMPLISDPGFRLLSLIIKMGGEVVTVPGPSAITAALAISGLSSDRVLFLGFLPKKQSKKNKYWLAIKSFSELGLTVAIYESGNRVLKTIEELGKEFGEETEMVIARELTKMHEEVIRGTAKEIGEKLKAKTVKGELVLLWRLAKL